METITNIPIFYDAEFTGLHKNTTPISIGLTTNEGCYFYAEFTDYDQAQVDDWIRDNVISNLIFNDNEDDRYVYKETFFNHGVYLPIYNIEIKAETEVIKLELLKWLEAISNNEDNKKLQFCADCYAYDWVILNDLIGTNGSALKVPSYINYIPIDLSTALFMKWIDPDISREEFIGDSGVKTILESNPFSKWKSVNPKHNCLWDAYVCKMCFHEL